MSLKLLSVFNTLLAFLYLTVVQSGKTTGIWAFVVLALFGLGIICMIVLAGLTRPDKMNVRYILIVTLRAILFLSVPLLTTTAARIAFILTLPVLDYLQASLPLHPLFLRGLTRDEEEVLTERTSLFFKTTILAGLFLGSLTAEYIVTSGVILFPSLIWIIKQEKSRFRSIWAIECFITALLRMAFHLDLIPVSMRRISGGLFFVLIVFLNYKCLKDFDKSSKTTIDV